VVVQGQGVDHQGIAEQVQLPGMPEAVRPTEVVRVDDPSIDGLRVVPPRVESREVRIRWRNGADALGAVEPPDLVLIGGVETHRDLTAPYAWGRA